MAARVLICGSENRTKKMSRRTIETAEISAIHVYVYVFIHFLRGHTWLLMV